MWSRVCRCILTSAKKKRRSKCSWICYEKTKWERASKRARERERRRERERERERDIEKACMCLLKQLFFPLAQAEVKVAANHQTVPHLSHSMGSSGKKKALAGRQTHNLHSQALGETEKWTEIILLPFSKTYCPVITLSDNLSYLQETNFHLLHLWCFMFVCVGVSLWVSVSVCIFACMCMTVSVCVMHGVTKRHKPVTVSMAQTSILLTI